MCKGHKKRNVDEEDGHTHTHGHTAWLIPNCVSAGIFYSRGKWAVTDATAAHILNKKVASVRRLGGRKKKTLKVTQNSLHMGERKEKTT